MAAASLQKKSIPVKQYVYCTSGVQQDNVKCRYMPATVAYLKQHIDSGEYVWCHHSICESAYTAAMVLEHYRSLTQNFGQDCALVTAARLQHMSYGLSQRA